MRGPGAPWRLASTLLGVALLVPGCGGDDGEGSAGESSATEVVSQPEPAEPISTRVEAFNEAIAAQDCEQLAPLAISLTRPTSEPGAPPSEAECRGTEPVLRELSGVEHTDSAEFGTGALAEGAPRRGSSAPRSIALWVVDRNGSYNVLSTVDTGPQLETEVVDQEAVEETAREFVEAVEGDDCTALGRLLDRDSRFVAGSASASRKCEAIIDGQLFAPALESTTDPELEFLGGTRGFAFVGVPTQDAYFTIVLGTENAGGKLASTIMDVLPSTDIALPESEDSSSGG